MHKEVWPVKMKEQTLNVWHIQGTRSRSLLTEEADTLEIAIEATSAYPTWATDTNEYE